MGNWEKRKAAQKYTCKRSHGEKPGQVLSTSHVQPRLISERKIAETIAHQHAQPKEEKKSITS